ARDFGDAVGTGRAVRGRHRDVAAERADGVGDARVVGRDDHGRRGREPLRLLPRVLHEVLPRGPEQRLSGETSRREPGGQDDEDAVPRGHRFDFMGSIFGASKMCSSGAPTPDFTSKPGSAAWIEKMRLFDSTYAFGIGLWPMFVVSMRPRACPLLRT